jgi:rod shape-determining protein MreD
MRNIVAVPLLGLVVIVQSAIVGQVSLLAGFADIVLVMLVAWALQERVTTAFHWAFLAGVMVSLVSRLPWFIYLAGYGGAVLLAQALQRRVWQVPMLAMFSVTFLGTILVHLLSFLYLAVSGETISLADSLGLVTLPSVLLNMLISIPIFGMMRDLAGWVFSGVETV